MSTTNTTNWLNLITINQNLIDNKIALINALNEARLASLEKKEKLNFKRKMRRQKNKLKKSNIFK